MHIKKTLLLKKGIRVIKEIEILCTYVMAEEPKIKYINSAFVPVSRLNKH